MAKQDINLGTQPTGVGGDTNRSANLKMNANITELYKAMGGSLSGGNGSVLPAGGLPIANGGTGATTAPSARTNLGLGTAAVKDVGTQAGNVMEVGAFGLGSTIPNISLRLDTIDAAPTQIASWYETWAVIHFKNQDLYGLNKPNWSQLLIGRNGTKGVMIRSAYNGAEVQYNLRGEHNTTIDGNGFIKAASPIVQLYSDKIELNDEAKLQNITFEKLGVGDYLIKGSSGFAQEGWYVEQPKDANGNLYHAVVYDTLENGDISVKTYEQKLDGVKIVVDLDKPVDIKENRFISIRLQELPQQPIEAPQPDPTITDYQGNPAPSHLHELVDGTWTISSESAAILENERLSAMPALTRRQFRLALVLNGYNLADIETLINSIEDPMQRQITMIEWQDATTFHRTNPSLIVMAGLMGLGAETVDQLWLQASTL